MWKSGSDANRISWQFVGSRISIQCEVANSSNPEKTEVIVESDRFADFEVNEKVYISYSPDRLHVLSRDS